MLDVLMKWDARTIPTIASPQDGSSPYYKCFVLKDRIQALVDAGVLTLKSEQKKVTVNMVTLEFGKTPKVTVPDGTFPIPAPRLEVKHPSVKTQENKGLVPLTLETGKIMWIHPVSYTHLTLPTIYSV